MKKIIGMLICSAVFAMAYPYNHKPTDYINGKWYTCESVKIDTNGDTLYYSSIYGDKKWYTYIKPHKRSTARYSDGKSCKMSYSENWLAMNQTCSDGSWYKATYDKNGNITKLWTETATTTWTYDARGNKIYEHSDDSKNWIWGGGPVGTRYKYKGTTLLSTKKSSLIEGYTKEETTTFYPNGNKKYEKLYMPEDSGEISYDIIEVWFDEHGYQTRFKSHTRYRAGKSNIKETYYKNRYDKKGRIVFEGAVNWSQGYSYQYFESDGIQYKCLVE